jgi:hypothetical protein
MLAALVEPDQVSLWPVVPGAEASSPPPNEISFLSVDEPAAGSPRTGWGIESSITPPIELPGESVAAEPPADDALFDRLAQGPSEPHPFEARPLPDIDLPPAAPAVDSSPSAPGSESFMPTAESRWTADSRARAVDALEAMARRVRNGEIVLPQGPSLGSDAAVLAAVLTALLEGRD